MTIEMSKNRRWSREDGGDWKLDRSGWPPGPWDDEPDRVEWRHAGLPCLMVRNNMGAWCGYVAVPPGHPFHGRAYDAVDADVDAHGGLTFASPCHEGSLICHEAAPGEPGDVWWLGFDCIHGGDESPGMLAIRSLPSWVASGGRPAAYDHAAALAADRGAPCFGGVDVYRDLPYVTARTNELAEQLAERA